MRHDVTGMVGLPAVSEVLSEAGWIDVSKVRRSTKLWVVNPDTGICELKNATRKMKVAFDGRLTSFTTPEFGFLVTPTTPVLYKLPKSFVVKRAADASPRTPTILSAASNTGYTSIAESILGIALAVIRYGIVDESGYSVRIRDPEHRRAFCNLLKRRGVERAGWEKWASVLSSPIVRGFNLDLSKVGANQAASISSLFRYWLQGAALTPQQLNQFAAYFTRSGVACKLDRGALCFINDRAPVIRKSTAPYKGVVVNLYVGGYAVIARQQGCSFVIGGARAET